MIKLLLLGILSLTTSNAVLSKRTDSVGVNLTCPTWTYPFEGDCHCGDFLHEIVMCNNITKDISLLKCYCMTVSETGNSTQTLLGNCMFNCKMNNSIRSYYTVSHDQRSLNERTCGIYNREGQMCGKCRAGYGVAVYSHSNNCTECVQYRHNWIKYVGIAFLPLTLFYIAFVIFRIRISHPILNSYILVSQIITTPAMATLNEFSNSQNSVILNILINTYGIWNLDFGRSLYKPFCLHPHLTTHQVIALDYLIAVYPLLLILLTYLLVRLHDNYRLAVLIWRPFYWCVRHVQKEWQLKASLVDVFATFLLLANVKLLNVSFDLISAPVTLWNVTGHSLPRRYTYLNGSLEYLGREHVPYFVLGVVVILLFNVLPLLLLCLYPLHCCRRCLHRCSLSKPSLHIFMDAFQGCYRTSPRDYRSLSAFAFIFRLVNFMLFFFTINFTYYVLLGTASVASAFFILSVLPYKARQQSVVEGLLLLTLGMLAFLLDSSKELTHANPHYKRLYFFLKSVAGLMPNMVLGLWMTLKLFTHIKNRVAKPLTKWISCRMKRISEETVPLLSAFAEKSYTGSA